MNDLLNIFLKSTLDFSVNGLLLLHFLLVTYFIGVIISVRRPVGVAFAWIFIVMTFPVIGISLYVLIGERPVGRKLTRKITRMNREYAKITEDMRSMYAADKLKLPIQARSFSLLAEANNGTPVVDGNKVELHTNSLQILQLFIRQILMLKVRSWSFIERI